MDESRASVVERLRHPRTWVNIALGVVIVVAAVLLAQNNSSYADAYKKNADEIASLEGDISDITGTKTLTVSEAKKMVASAQDAGGAVADLQNSYGTTDDVPGVSDKLAAYFASNSANAKSIWFNTKTVQGASWSFSAPYTFTAGSIPVVWQCRKDGELLAYATGSYTAAAGKFSDVEVTVMAAGNKALRDATAAEVEAQSDGSFSDTIKKTQDDSEASSSSDSDSVGTSSEDSSGSKDLTDEQRKEVESQSDGSFMQDTQ